MVGPSPSPAPVWVTPPSRDPKFNSHFMQNALQRVLATPPGRLVSVRVRQGVFRQGSVCLFLHGSLTSATLAFKRLPLSREVEDDFTAVGSRGQPVRLASAIVGTGLNSSHGSASQCCARIRLGSVPLQLLNAPACVSTCAGLPPAPGAACGLVTSNASAASERDVNAHSSKPTYLQVAFTPARPSPPKPKRVAPNLSPDVCFRCLASDHKVSACRDPVRCRKCLRCGHRQHECPLALADLLTLGRRRSPTVLVPAARRSVHVVPFEPRPSNASSPERTPPSPPTPFHELAPTAAFDPLLMIPSSSTEAPFLEVPRRRATASRALWSAPAQRPQDKFVLGGRGKEVRCGPPSPELDNLLSRSPPPSPSRPRPPPSPAHEAGQNRLATGLPASASSDSARVLGLALVLARCLVDGGKQELPALEANQASPPCDSSVFSLDIEPAPPTPAPTPASPSLAASLCVRPRRRAARAVAGQAPSRHSARIAARSNGDFVNVPYQAVRRKALLNALSSCSSALKKQVRKRNILSRNKLPMSATDIRKLVSAASATCSGAASVGVVTEVVE